MEEEDKMKVEEAFKEWDKVLREIDEKIEKTAKKTGMIPELSHDLIENIAGDVMGSSIFAQHFKRSNLQ